MRRLKSTPIHTPLHPKFFPLPRLVLSASLGILIALLILSILPPWIFTYALTHPGCNDPNPIAGLPQPKEHLLRTADGLALRAWYYPSKNKAGIIALGGMGGSLGTNLPPVEILVRQGYGILQIDGRACAQPAAPVTLGYWEAQDAATGYAFLRNQPEIDTQRIGVYGFSMGGAAAIRFASREPGVAAVVVDGGYSNLGENFAGYGQGGMPTRWMGFISGLAFRLQTGIDPFTSNPAGDISAISPRPLLLIYGEAEAGSPLNTLWQAAGLPKERWIVPGGSHGRNHLAAPDEYFRRVVEFFNLALNPLKVNP